MEISPAKRVGRIIALLRDEAGKTQAEVGKIAHVSDSLISHLENGNKGAHIDTITKIGAAIRHKEVVAELWGFIGDAGVAATIDLLASYEAEAIRISTWTTTVAHGLLQAEPYARAVIRAALPFAPEAEIDELVARRLQRQQVLARDDAPMLWCLLDESVLHRPYGGPAVMRAELDYITQQAERPNVVVQVVPYAASGRHPGLEGPLAIIEFAGKTPAWMSDAWSAGKLSDDRDEVSSYIRLYDVIRSQALSPADTMTMISKIRSMHDE